MEIYQILKKDHQEVLHTLDQLEKTTDAAVVRRKELVRKLTEELIPHTRAEERVLYDVLKDIEMTEDVTLQAFEEHKNAELILRELDYMDTSDKRFLAKVAVLKEALVHHIHQEENEMFSRAQSLLTKEEADMMGQAFKELKSEVRDGSLVQSALNRVADYMPARFSNRFRDLMR